MNMNSQVYLTIGEMFEEHPLEEVVVALVIAIGFCITECNSAQRKALIPLLEEFAAAAVEDRAPVILERSLQ